MKKLTKKNLVPLSEEILKEDYKYIESLPETVEHWVEACMVFMEDKQYVYFMMGDIPSGFHYYRWEKTPNYIGIHCARFTMNDYVKLAD